MTQCPPQTLLPHDEIEALAVRAAAGDKAAEATLAVAFKPLIVRLSAPFPDYEDARADGVLWTLEAVQAFDPAKKVYFSRFLKAFLSRRYCGRWRTIDTEAVPFEETHSGAADNVAEAERAAELTAKIDRLAAAIPELSNLERAIIEAAYFRAMSRRAIAQSRGISPETVKTAKERAIKKLRKKFEKI